MANILKKTKNVNMDVGKGENLLVVGMKTGAITMEIKGEVPLKDLLQHLATPFLNIESKRHYILRLSCKLTMWRERYWE